jgi:hypothetical protein
MDFEHWEHDHTLITEFGYASACMHTGADVRAEGHFIVQYGPTRTTYRNGTYVDDNQEVRFVRRVPLWLSMLLVQNYRFGQSRRLSKPNLKRYVAGLVERAVKDGPLFLVFHDARGDMK